MSHDVHALSHRLHPSLLDHLGIEEALRAEAERFSGAESIAVELRLEELHDKPSPDAALCLYRIAQEALHNVARHARADRVEVSLRTTNGGCELVVRDNGVGFDPQKQRSGPNLGHASMRERVRLLSGRLAIRSVPEPRDHRCSVGAAARWYGLSRPRILLADDHPIVAEGLRSLLSARFDVVGVVEDGRALLEAARSLTPDVVVADISMPLVNGIEATRRLATGAAPDQGGHPDHAPRGGLRAARPGGRSSGLRPEGRGGRRSCWRRSTPRSPARPS